MLTCSSHIGDPMINTQSEIAITLNRCEWACRCLEQMGLGDMLAALERYMLMGAGDWAAALVQELSGASLLVELPGPHDLPRILDSAILVRPLLHHHLLVQA